MMMGRGICCFITFGGIQRYANNNSMKCVYDNMFVSSFLPMFYSSHNQCIFHLTMQSALLFNNSCAYIICNIHIESKRYLA